MAGACDVAEAEHFVRSDLKATIDGGRWAGLGRRRGMRPNGDVVAEREAELDAVTTPMPQSEPNLESAARFSTQNRNKILIAAAESEEFSCINFCFLWFFNCGNYYVRV